MVSSLRECGHPAKSHGPHPGGRGSVAQRSSGPTGICRSAMLGSSLRVWKKLRHGEPARLRETLTLGELLGTPGLLRSGEGRLSSLSRRVSELRRLKRTREVTQNQVRTETSHSGPWRRSQNPWSAQNQRFSQDQRFFRRVQISGPSSGFYPHSQNQLAARSGWLPQASRLCCPKRLG